MCVPRGQSWDEDQIAKYGLFAHLRMVRETAGYGAAYRREKLLKEFCELLEAKKTQIN